MTFIHGYLLGGLLLVGVPILLHLIMRQKPRQLSFPAFRFLRQKLFVNRRKIRLQNLLLLLLRMLLIALLCLALARPRVQTGAIPFSPDQEVAAVFVFDTSPSMEYSVGSKTRLEEARERARELLGVIAGGSRVAVLDSAEEIGGDDNAQEWLSSAQARTRIDNLRIRLGNWPLNRAIEHACDLLNKAGDAPDAVPRFLYVFSDRTTASWDGKAAAKIKAPTGVTIVYVDVGVENPRDLSIDNLMIDPPVAVPGQPMHIRATVRATGETAAETEIVCQFDNETRVDRQVVAKLARDEQRVFDFERTAPPLVAGDDLTTYQATVRLGSNDALPSNNVRYATFAVRNRRKVLTIVPDKLGLDLARAWTTALKYAPGMFEADVRTVDEASKLGPNELKTYKVVCLFEVTDSGPLWSQLGPYVKKGGGLVIVPPGKEMDKEKRESFNKAGANVLPASLDQLIVRPAKADDDAPTGLLWTEFTHQPNHFITKPLYNWSRTADPDFTRREAEQGSDLRPRVNGYWLVQAKNPNDVVATYDDGANHPPALVERAIGTGRSVMFTVPLDGGIMEGSRKWNNYWSDSSFGFILVDLVCRYLAGETTAVDLNYLCRERFTIPQPTTAPAANPPYKLIGPGLSESESTLTPTGDQSSLDIPATLEAGNFIIRNKDDRTVVAFSMNIRNEEYRLERIAKEEIEAVLGSDSVLPVENTDSIIEMITERLPHARELLPYLMIFLLLMMPIESVLANLFTRRQAEPSAK